MYVHGHTVVVDCLKLHPVIFGASQQTVQSPVLIDNYFGLLGKIHHYLVYLAHQLGLYLQFSTNLEGHVEEVVEHSIVELLYLLVEDALVGGVVGSRQLSEYAYQEAGELVAQ